MIKMTPRFLMGFFAVMFSSAALADQDVCGRIQSLPDSFKVISKSATVYFEGLDESPRDSKDVYGYLNTNSSDSDRSCYCISGVVEKQYVGKRIVQRFTEVTGLKTCQGRVLK